MGIISSICSNEKEIKITELEDTITKLHDCIDIKSKRISGLIGEKTQTDLINADLKLTNIDLESKLISYYIIFDNIDETVKNILANEDINNKLLDDTYEAAHIKKILEFLKNKY